MIELEEFRKLKGFDVSDHSNITADQSTTAEMFNDAKQFQEKPFSLYQGDCLELMKPIPDKSVDLILCDLPYGEVNQKSSGLRLLDRGNADTCDMDLKIVVQEFNRICKGTIYAFCGTEQISLLVGYFKSHGMTTRVCVWEKTNPSPMNGTRLWLSGLEFCVFARKPTATFNEHCKKALWQAPSGRAKIHPTEKPVKLMERLILASSNPDDVVLDNCMGSGTTGVACANTGRRFIGMEQDAAYFEIARSRIEDAFDKRGESADLFATEAQVPHG